MPSKGQERAQKFIRYLQGLTKEQYDDVLNTHKLREIEYFCKQIRSSGLESTFTLPTTKTTFSTIYLKMEAQGINNPESYIKEEADFINELKNNPDSIGIDFITQVKAMRIKMAAHFAPMADVSSAKCEAILHDFLTHEPVPDASISDDEKAYVKAYRTLFKHGLEKGHYVSEATEAPAKSPWAERVRMQDAMNKEWTKESRFN